MHAGNPRSASERRRGTEGWTQARRWNARTGCCSAGRTTSARARSLRPTRQLTRTRRSGCVRTRAQCGKTTRRVRRAGSRSVVNVETEVPALWRKPSKTAIPSTLDKSVPSTLHRKMCCAAKGFPPNSKLLEEKVGGGGRWRCRAVAGRPKRPAGEANCGHADGGGD